MNGGEIKQLAVGKSEDANGGWLECKERGGKKRNNDIEHSIICVVAELRYSDARVPIVCMRAA